MEQCVNRLVPISRKQVPLCSTAVPSNSLILKNAQIKLNCLHALEKLGRHGSQGRVILLFLPREFTGMMSGSQHGDREEKWRMYEEMFTVCDLNTISCISGCVCNKNAASLMSRR